MGCNKGELGRPSGAGVSVELLGGRGAGGKGTLGGGGRLPISFSMSILVIRRGLLGAVGEVTSGGASKKDKRRLEL